MAIPVNQIAKPEPRRDGNGRYIVHDENGNPAKYTRATTIAKTLDDTHGLAQWQLRRVAYGIGQREDLQALAASHHPDTDPKIYAQLIKDAEAAAANNAAASTGTALHKFTEQIDAETHTINDIPERWRPRIQQYTDTLTAHGIQIHPNWIETVILEDRYQVAGTCDRIVTLPDGRTLVADLKTGRNLGWLGIGVQMAIYANHTATYNYTTNTRGPRIQVDTTEAIIIHLPQNGDTCTIHALKLENSWANYITSHEVRAARRYARNDARIYKPEPGTGGANAQRDWLQTRIDTIKQAGHITDVINRWPNDIPKPFPTDPTNQQIDQIAAICDRVEAAHEIPFGPPRPGTETTTATKKETKTK